ncbi:hypothetical protein EG327_002372 [Venturia inaequalis]|uniref:LYR motif-containing protein Cup1-like N-terminal domain-containing protein n=1 Tax=Venturia inaequalis TaxID=5025 RepID=A0A8H3VKX2_VENIN|nr:hypothetical protein EG327_002372 [Venturia inaequalis]
MQLSTQYPTCIRALRAASRVPRCLFSSTAPSKTQPLTSPYEPKAQTDSEVEDEARRLLRSLLREASYLPDSSARAWVKQQITSRFERQSRNRKRKLKKGGDDAVAKAAVANDFKKAYKALRQLQAANNGEIAQLDKVLRLTYGRTGPYRRQLLEPLLTADPLPDSNAVDEQLLRRQGPKTSNKSEWTIDTVPVDKVFQQPPILEGDQVNYVLSPQYSKFKAVVESQVQVRPPEMRGTVLRRANYKMPQKNTWDRMMPRLRVKKMVHAAYAKLLDKVHPPLKNEEWDRLHGLVHGTITGEGYVSRRKRIAERPGTLTSYDLEKLARLDDTALPSERRGEDEWLNNDVVVEDAKEDLLRDELSIGRRLDKSIQGARAGHQITPRFMQKMWLRIFEACPKLNWDEERDRWMVIWGSRPTSFGKQQHNDDLAPLFEALDQEIETDKKRRELIIKPLRKNDTRKPRRVTTPESDHVSADVQAPSGTLDSKDKTIEKTKEKEWPQRVNDGLARAGF